MSNIEIRPATTGDLLYVGNNLRAADFEEYLMSTGRHPRSNFAKSLQGFDDLLCGTADGTPACIFGCHRGGQGGVPWFMGTEAIEGLAVARTMVREGRRLFKQWTTLFGPLGNYVYASNELHIKYIKAIGCTLGEPTRWGAQNLEYLPFTYSQGG